MPDHISASDSNHTSADERTHSDWQESVARASVDEFLQVADGLESIAAGIFAEKVTYTSPYGDPTTAAGTTDWMLLSFVEKQRLHLRTLRILIDADAHRDATLIGRTMLEGTVLLAWALQNPEHRPAHWLWFGAVEDWRQLRQNEQNGLPGNAEGKARLEEIAHHYRYYSNDAQKAIKSSQSLPDDPWAKTWPSPSTKDMFDAIGWSELHEQAYRSASEWIHWSPRALHLAIVNDDRRVAGFTNQDWRWASIALSLGTLAMARCLSELDRYFNLGRADAIEALSQRTHSIMTTALDEDAIRRQNRFGRAQDNPTPS